jgi:dCTP deaminase
MMLSGKAIRGRLDPASADPLVIWPLFDAAKQIDDTAASFDVRLGTRFAAAKRRRLTHIDAYAHAAHQTAFVDEHYVPVGGEFVIHPRHFVLATTLEWVRLPGNLAAYVTGKSTLARMGLNIATAVGIHPRFAGTITLEMANLADVPIRIQVGQPIGQLFFHSVLEPPGKEEMDRTAFVGTKRPLVGTLKVDTIERYLGIKTPEG